MGGEQPLVVVNTAGRGGVKEAGHASGVVSFFPRSLGQTAHFTLAAWTSAGPSPSVLPTPALASFSERRVNGPFPCVSSPLTNALHDL